MSQLKGGTPSKRVRMWAGFVSGRLHMYSAYGDWGACRQAALFTSRKRAKLAYEDVRRVEVREVKS